MKTEEEIRRDLTSIATEGTPKLRPFANWLLDNLPSVAFKSIRRLAEDSAVNPNTVIRLAQLLGYGGYDAFRADVQAQMGRVSPLYGTRARALQDLASDDLYASIARSCFSNVESIFAADVLDLLDSCVEPLLAANKVYAVGVRACFPVAHYFSYGGRYAFDNFVTTPSLPGEILDQMTRTTEADIVIGISYAHYSSEVIRACKIANGNGARVIAMTDSFASPIARDAWKVIKLPMEGPQFMPSLIAAMAATEVLLAAMAARSETAAQNIDANEDRLRLAGSYDSN